MDKDENVWDGLVKIGLILGSIWLGSEIIKKLSKEDKGDNSKKNYALCKELGISEVFIDFKSNNEIRRAKSDLWREKLRLYKEHKDIWNQTYRFRVIVEGVFSAMKRKNVTYLRSKKEVAQDVEVLLKVLVYNLTIIGKYS